MKQLLTLLLFAAVFLSARSQHEERKNHEVTFSIVQTSDVHGNFFPYDFISRKPGSGSLSRVATYLRRLREEKGRFNVLYMDNGDILQGQPSAYYYNYVETQTPHLAARMLNSLDCLCATMGNHDIETGHSVYDRWMSDCSFSVLGANVMDTVQRKGYLTAYLMEEVDGIQVGVLGLVTPAIPQTIPEAAWSGMGFRDMVETARRVVPIIRRAGKADVVVVLMHSGAGPAGSNARMLDHAALQVAEQVPDIDVVFAGHDHRLLNRRVANLHTGQQVLLLNPADNANYVAQANFRLRLNADRKIIDKTIEGQLVKIDSLPPDTAFLREFAPDFQAVREYTEQIIGENRSLLETRSAFFGPSALVDYIHTIQLRVSGADISFAAPLSFDVQIPEGDIRMSDLFRLYKYENQLCLMRLTGKEIKDYLEASYAGWTRQMKSPAESMLLFHPEADAQSQPWQRLQHSSFNFDSAAGIRYTVDLRKPQGQKVAIRSMADGKPFSLTRTYRVALNSYRAMGGGQLLTRGAGIAPEKLRSRIISTTDREMRHYLLEDIRRRRKLEVEPLFHWQFIPAGWAAGAGERDAERLFKP